MSIRQTPANATIKDVQEFIEGIAIDQQKFIASKTAFYQSVLLDRFKFLEFSGELNKRFFTLGMTLGTFGVYFPQNIRKSFYDRDFPPYDQLIFFKYQIDTTVKEKNAGVVSIIPDPNDVERSGGLLPGRPLKVNEECIIFNQKSVNLISDADIIKDTVNKLAKIKSTIEMLQFKIRLQSVPVSSSLHPSTKKAVLKMLKSIEYTLLSLDKSLVNNISFDNFEPDLIAKLKTYYDNEENELKTFLGIDNLGVPEKKEHLINQEMLIRSDLILQTLGSYNLQVESFAKKFTEIFGFPLTVLVMLNGIYIDVSTSKKYFAVKGAGGAPDQLTSFALEGVANAERILSNGRESVNFYAQFERPKPGSGSVTDSPSESGVPPISPSGSDYLPVYAPFLTVEEYERYGYTNYNYLYNSNYSQGFFGYTANIFTSFLNWIRYGRNSNITELSETTKKRIKDLIEITDSKNIIDDKKLPFYKRISKKFKDNWNDFNARINELISTIEAYSRVGFAIGLFPSILFMGALLLIKGKKENLPGSHIINSEEQVSTLSNLIYNSIESGASITFDKMDRSTKNLSVINKTMANVQISILKMLWKLVPIKALSFVLSYGVEYFKMNLIYNVFYSISKEFAESLGDYLPYQNNPELSGRIAGSLAVATYRASDYDSLAGVSIAYFIDYTISDIIKARDLTTLKTVYNSLPSEVLKVPLLGFIFTALVNKIYEKLTDGKPGIGHFIGVASYTVGKGAVKLSFYTVKEFFKFLNAIVKAYYNELTKQGVVDSPAQAISLVDNKEIAKEIVEKGLSNGLDLMSNKIISSQVSRSMNDIIETEEEKKVVENAENVKQYFDNLSEGMRENDYSGYSLNDLKKERFEGKSEDAVNELAKRLMDLAIDKQKFLESSGLPEQDKLNIVKDYEDRMIKIRDQIEEYNENEEIKKLEDKQLEDNIDKLNKEINQLEEPKQEVKEEIKEEPKQEDNEYLDYIISERGGDLKEKIKPFASKFNIEINDDGSFSFELNRYRQFCKFVKITTPKKLEDYIMKNLNIKKNVDVNKLSYKNVLEIVEKGIELSIIVENYKEYSFIWKKRTFHDEKEFERISDKLHKILRELFGKFKVRKR